MNPPVAPDQTELEARRTLLLLNARCSALRDELLQLQTELRQTRHRIEGARISQLQQANEHLLLAALNADQVAQTALTELDQLAQRSQLDVLTETPNRNLMLDRLQVAMAHARRDKRHVAVLFIDLDHFKDINDSLGHAVGDEVLRSVARRLESQLRDSDTVSRHGGDEFLVLLADVEDPASVSLTAAKLLAALSQPCQVCGHQLHLSASLGMAIYPEDGDDPATLIHGADTAMYRTKLLHHQAGVPPPLSGPVPTSP